MIFGRAVKAISSPSVRSPCLYTKKLLYKKHREIAMVIGLKILTSKRPRPHCGKCPKPSSSCSWWIRLPPILGIEKPESITIFQFWRPAGRSRRGVKHQPIFYTSPSLSALQTRLLDGAIAHWSKFTPYPSVLDFWKIKFEKSSFTNWIFYLQKSILKFIFAGYTSRKNPVRRTGFFQLDFSKIKCVKVANFIKVLTLCPSALDFRNL